MNITLNVSENFISARGRKVKKIEKPGRTRAVSQWAFLSLRQRTLEERVVIMSRLGTRELLGLLVFARKTPRRLLARLFGAQHFPRSLRETCEKWNVRSLHGACTCRRASGQSNDRDGSAAYRGCSVFPSVDQFGQMFRDKDQSLPEYDWCHL